MKDSMLVIWCCIGLILLVGVNKSFAQSYLNTTLIGEVRSGGFSDLAVYGEHSYVGHKNSIDIFRISNISKPVRVASLPISFPVQSLAVSGQYLFVGGTSLQIFDLEDPINLKALGTYSPPTPSSLNKIRIYGTNVFTSQQNKLIVLDFSDPNNLQLQGTIEDANWYLTDIAVNDTIAFCPSQRLGMVIIDISDLTNPKQIGVYDTPGFANGVAIRDEVLYVADGNFPSEERGLRVFDISQPANLQQISFLPTSGDPWMIELSGHYAYISDRPGLRVVDISNPATPVEIGQYVNQQSWTHNLAIGNQAIFLNTGYGISILDISNPSNIIETSVIGSFGPGVGYSVAIRGNFAYLVDKAEGLRVINCNDVNYMFESKCLNTPGSATVVVIDSTFAYVADGNTGLRIIDITVPDNPNEIGFIDTPGSAANVFIQGHYAYVADGSTGLRIIDVTDPADPKEVGFYDSPAKVTASTIINQIAYITDYTAGFRIIDISNPSSPVEIGAFDTPGVASDLAIAGNYAYIADGSKGLRILDITDPKNIKEVGFFDTVGNATCIRKNGSYIYIADGNYGLRIIDVSEVTNPNEVGYYDSPGTASGIEVLGSLIYIADGSEPLKIIRNELITSVKQEHSEKPEDFTLAQNYPNPFNAMTTIGYQIKENTRVELSIYNTLGQRIANLVDEWKTAGKHQVLWNGRNERGEDVSAGIYLYQFRAADFIKTKKMLLLR